MHLQQFWCTVTSAPGHLSHCIINASNRLTFLMYATSDLCSLGTKGLASCEHWTPNVARRELKVQCVSRCILSAPLHELCKLALLHAANRRSALLYATLCESLYCYIQWFHRLLLHAIGRKSMLLGFLNQTTATTSSCNCCSSVINGFLRQSIRLLLSDRMLGLCSPFPVKSCTRNEAHLIDTYIDAIPWFSSLMQHLTERNIIGKLHPRLTASLVHRYAHSNSSFTGEAGIHYMHVMLHSVTKSQCWTMCTKVDHFFALTVSIPLSDDIKGANQCLTCTLWQCKQRLHKRECITLIVMSCVQGVQGAKHKLISTSS